MRDRRAFGFVWVFFFSKRNREREIQCYCCYYFENEFERVREGLESFRVLRADLRRELEKESNGKEKRIRLKKNRKKCSFNTGRN